MYTLNSNQTLRKISAVLLGASLSLSASYAAATTSFKASTLTLSDNAKKYITVKGTELHNDQNFKYAGVRASYQLKQSTQWRVSIAGNSNGAFVGLSDYSYKTDTAPTTKGTNNVWGVNLGNFAGITTFDFRYDVKTRAFEMSKDNGSSWIFIANLDIWGAYPFFMVRDGGLLTLENVDKVSEGYIANIRDKNNNSISLGQNTYPTDNIALENINTIYKSFSVARVSARSTAAIQTPSLWKVSLLNNQRKVQVGVVNNHYPHDTLMSNRTGSGSLQVSLYNKGASDFLFRYTPAPIGKLEYSLNDGASWAVIGQGLQGDAYAAITFYGTQEHISVDFNRDTLAQYADNTFSAGINAYGLPTTQPEEKVAEETPIIEPPVVEAPSDENTSQDPIVVAPSEPSTPITDIVMPAFDAEYIFLSEQNVAAIQANIEADSTNFNAFISRLEHYMNTIPYDKALYAGSYALGYRLTGNEVYATKALDLMEMRFFDEAKPYRYDNADEYRQYFQFLAFTFNWLKDEMSDEQRTKVEEYISFITAHWIEKIGFTMESGQPEYDGDYMRISDSDRTIAYGYNLLVGGVVLPESEVRTNALLAADYTYESHVIPTFLEGSMKGQFTEGTGYGPNTVTFLVKTFAINEQVRGKKYDTSWFDGITKTLWHETLPAFNSLYIHGDVETQWNIEYPKVLSSLRMLDYVHHLYAVANPESDALLSAWEDKALAQYDEYPTAANFSGMWGVLFQTHESDAQTPAEQNLPDYMHAEGRNFVAMRSSWEEDASVVYFSNSKSSVDHQHYDQLSFEIAKGDSWITNEVTGYGVNAYASIMHNTLLVEGAYSNYTEGSPVYSQGEGKMITFDVAEDYGYINADAVDVYNFFQWKESNHVEAMNRKLFYIKPNVVVVYDHVETNKNEVFDFKKFRKAGFETVTEHTRWIKYIQHFEAQPEVIGDNTYIAQANGHYMSFETLLPAEANINVVNEKEYFNGIYNDQGELVTNPMSKHNAPDNQRKWHISVQPENQTEITDFMTVIAFDEESKIVVPETTLINKESGNVLSGDIKGVEMDVNGDAYAIIFNENGDDLFVSNQALSFKLENARPTLYVTGLKGGHTFMIETTTDNAGDTVVTITEDDNGTAEANENGVMTINL